MKTWKRIFSEKKSLSNVLLKKNFLLPPFSQPCSAPHREDNIKILFMNFSSLFIRLVSLNVLGGFIMAKNTRKRSKPIASGFLLFSLLFNTFPYFLALPNVSRTFNNFAFRIFHSIKSIRFETFLKQAAEFGQKNFLILTCGCAKERQTAKKGGRRSRGEQWIPVALLTGSPPSKKIEIFCCFFHQAKETLSDSICLLLPSINVKHIFVERFRQPAREEWERSEKGLITPFNLRWLLLVLVSLINRGTDERSSKAFIAITFHVSAKLAYFHHIRKKVSSVKIDWMSRRGRISEGKAECLRSDRKKQL